MDFFETNRQVPALLTLREKEENKTRIGKIILGERMTMTGDVETENVEFNKRFQIRTKDLQHAFYILTPHFMEYIIKADDLSDARMYFAFIENRIHILLGSEKNLFETTKKRSIRHCCCSCAC